MPSASYPPSLVKLGWDDGWVRALAATGAEDGDSSLTAGRVSRIDRGAFTVLTAEGRKRVAADAGLPVAVGDWVAVSPGQLPGDQWRLGVVLGRRSAFRRTSDGPGSAEQVVAANVDTVMVVDALDSQLSARHLARYLALAWQSGGVPVVVITKADLVSPGELRARTAAVASTAVGVSVHATSAATGVGLDRLAPYLGPGRTVVLLGLSGAGKSTLVNRLAGDDRLATGRVRADGKGRHTTSHRELVALAGGGLMIDTPGMRALSVSTAGDGVVRAMVDIEALGNRCQFSDCSHAGEPGCAVLAAVASGGLTAARLESWRHLSREAGPQDRRAVRHQVEVHKQAKVTAKLARTRSRMARRTSEHREAR